MELRTINTFVRVASFNSFTKAANELGYSQSAVTIQIKQLENELQFPLFDRIGKKVTLTPRGEEFLMYAREFLRLEAHALSLKDDVAAVSGTLRLGVIESLLVWKITELLPEYNRLYPGVKVEIKTETGATLYKMLLQNDLDLIYLLNNVIYYKDCLCVCTSPVSVKFVTFPEHRLCAYKNVPLEEIAKEPLIFSERDTIYRRELDLEAAKNNIELIPILEIDNLEVIIRLLKRKMGVSFLPNYIIREYVENGELSELRVACHPIELSIQLVYHRSKFVTKQMSTFINMICETCTNTEK